MAYTFKKVAEFLKKSSGVKKPIKVRRVKMSDDLDGECEYYKGQYTIKINRTLNEAHAIDVLMHEIAHAMSWNTEANDHGRQWGIAYSKVYRMFLDGFVESE